jgi:hypothetical protein
MQRLFGMIEVGWTIGVDYHSEEGHDFGLSTGVVDCRTAGVEYNYDFSFSNFVGVVVHCITEQVNNCFGLKAAGSVKLTKNLNLARTAGSFVMAAHSIIVIIERGLVIVMGLAILPVASRYSQIGCSLYSVGFKANSNIMVEFIQEIAVIQELAIKFNLAIPTEVVISAIKVITKEVQKLEIGSVKVIKTGVVKGFQMIAVKFTEVIRIMVAIFRVRVRTFV